MPRVAIVQAEIAPSLDAGLTRTRDLTHEAAAGGAQLVVFPETWLPGYPVWLDVCRDAGIWDHAGVKSIHGRMAANAVTVPGAAATSLGSLAAETGVVLVVGIVERVDAGPGRGTLYNAILTFGSDGKLLNHHRKLVPTYTERLVWGPGDADGLRAVDTSVGRIGSLVCWEHWMPLARQAMHDSGEDIHVALWPTAHEQLQLASRAYAFEGRCYVLAAGSLMRASALPPELEPHPDRVQSADQWVMRGGSSIIGPDGRYVVEPVYDQPLILAADLDLARLPGEHMALDVAGHYARPDVLRFDVVKSGRRVAE
jgi:predicted amidohydrolase